MFGVSRFNLKQTLVMLLFIMSSANLYAATFHYVMEVGETKTVSPGDKLYTYKVSDQSMVNGTMDPNGKYLTITALKPGTATCDVNYISGNVGYWHTYVIEVIDVQSITIPGSLTLKLGETYKFNPIIQDSRMERYLLEWKSEDSNIASIDNDYRNPIYNNWGQIDHYEYIRGGNLVANTPGTTRIFCTYKGMLAVCNLTVEPIYVSDMIFSQEEYGMECYQEIQLEPNILPENATCKDLTWKSSNPSVAVVDNKGKVVALNKGKTVITAIPSDGSMVIGNCVIKVSPEEKDELEINHTIDGYVQCSTKIERDSPFSLSIQPPTQNWIVESFNINGVNALEQLINGIYSIEHVDNSMNIETTFAYNGKLQFIDLTASGIESPIDNSTMSILKLDGRLCINNVKVGSNVKIFTMGGQLIGSHICSDSLLMIDLAPNYYIIFVDNVSLKIKI